MNDQRWRFEIKALTDPQSLARIIGYFAQRSIVPLEVTMRRVADVLYIAIVADDLEAVHAHIIAAKLAELFVVSHVELHGVQTVFTD